MNLVETIIQARQSAVPYLYIRTVDPDACITRLRKSNALRNFENPKEEVPLLQWDCNTGFSGLGADKYNGLSENKGGQATMMASLPLAQQQLEAQAQGTRLPPQLETGLQAERLASTRVETIALNMTDRFADYSVAFFYCLVPSEFFKTPQVIQMINTLRDKLAKKGKQIIFMGPHFSLPAPIANDIMIVNDPYPTLPELEQIVVNRHADVKANNPKTFDLTPEIAKQAALCMQGHTHFSANTAISMSFRQKGIDFPTLKDQLYTRIDEQPGLKIYRGTERFSQLKGLAGVQQLTLDYGRNGKRRPGCVVFIDEINMGSMASGGQGVQNHSTSEAILAEILKYLENRKILAMLMLGLPGTGKSAVSKALANELEIPGLEMTPDRMLSKWVGSTQENIERVFATIDAISGGYPLFMASCNSDDKLSDAFMDRFRMGHVFFDVPNRANKDAIWQVKMEEYGLEPQQIPLDEGWAGRNIDICCEKAAMLGYSLMKAASFVIPVSVMRPGKIESMRDFADKKYIDAASGRPFDKTLATIPAVEEKGGNSRKIFMPPEEVSH